MSMAGKLYTHMHVTYNIDTLFRVSYQYSDSTYIRTLLTDFVSKRLWIFLY